MGTAGPYPYPEPTDPIAQGADAIQSLAEAANTFAGRIAAGSVVVVAPAGSPATAQAAVTFPAGRFTAGPFVTCNTYGGGNVFLAATSAITTTGFTAIVFRRDGAGIAAGNYTVHWQAIQTP